VHAFLDRLGVLVGGDPDDVGEVDDRL